MRVHQQTSDHAPSGTWIWLLLLAALAAPTALAAPGADPSGVVRSADPVDLAADAIHAWSSGNAKWFYLRGRVAILQGIDGVRADEAVVRVSGDPAAGAEGYRFDVYAEGQVQPVGPPSPPRRALRTTLVSDKPYALKPYTKGGLRSEAGPPAGLAILARGFTPAPARPLALAAAAPPREAPAPAPLSPPLPPAAASPPVQSTAAPVRAAATVDRQVVPVQFEQERLPAPTPNTDAGFDPSPAPAPEAAPDGAPALVPAPAPSPGAPDLPGADEPVMENAPSVPNLSPLYVGPPTTLEPLPGPDGAPMPPLRSDDAGARPGNQPPEIPILPGTQRKTWLYPRSGGPAYTVQVLPHAGGYEITVIRGGVNLVTEAPPPTGTIELSADSMVIWRRLGAKKSRGPNGEEIEDIGEPMEIYLEGNVVIRQDTRQVAGNGDQKGYQARSAYYDMRTSRFIGLDAQLDMFAPGLIAPTKLTSPRIEQFRPLEQDPKGGWRFGLEQIQANRTVFTGSRFPVPGYRFNSRSVDITHIVTAKQNPNTGTPAGDPRDPNTPQDLTWRIDARQNVFYFGPIPAFYWPRVLVDADDFDPPLRQIRYGYVAYFGQEILTDFNAFRLFGIRRPNWIDAWTVDIDYLSLRSTQFPALGTELGWFGKDFLADLADPYRRNRRNSSPATPDGYFGYLDMWGLKDAGSDDLGSGPAIVTPNGDVILSNGVPAGKQGFQRNDVPPFQQFRGRINMRHMQSLLGEDADPYEDWRFQVEAAYISDRHFLEEYYKRLSETGLDEETLGYMIRQKENWAWSVWTEANLQNWYTDTQWLPKLDYYRLGDSPLANWLTYFQHSGVDYASTHTAVEVNNPNLFAFMPYDPISNTSGLLNTGRLYTNHEVDLPLNLQNIVRVVPYVQGQFVGWNNQIGGNEIGRVWGAAGARADIMAWRLYPDIENDLLNVHGLNHKITLEADYRNAYSNVKLNQIGVQDDLDDNTYEFVRRYFALTQYIGGVLPAQYDPRHLILRRTLSPITGTTDVQASIQTLQLNLHSRLQTKRGPEGRRRVTDFMTLDLSTTFFPDAYRDNFGKAFGQNMYNWQWFVGDRTSIVSYGWFEFFDITGAPTNKATTHLGHNPFGLNVISSGISISRPPRGNIYIGYTILDSGQVVTSALNPSISYWMSPKWYGTFSTMYDFANAILLGEMMSFTRIGADYLTTIGMSFDPQRTLIPQLNVAISPRISPGLRFGSATGLTQFDSRYAPTQ